MFEGKHSKKTKRKIAASLKGKRVPSRGRSGEDNPNAKYPELQNREWLAEQMQTKSSRTIAEELGAAHGSVNDAARRHGIARTRTAAMTRWVREQYPDGRFGRDAPNWKGGLLTKKYGKDKSGKDKSYIAVRAVDHPNAKNGYVLEHRLVMEKHLDRILDPEEVVHHKNGDTLDNRLLNLEIHTKRSHGKAHIEVDAENHRLKAENHRLKVELAMCRSKFGELK